jgi:hypothetical protein
LIKITLISPDLQTETAAQRIIIGCSANDQWLLSGSSMAAQPIIIGCPAVLKFILTGSR